MPGTFNPPTIQGAIKRQTENYNFLIPVFDAPGWGTSMERNFDVIDSVLFSVTGIGNVRGAWENATDYSIADRVTDVADNTLWQCYVDHVSASSGSFEDDRTANPTYWRQVTNGVVPRGDWVTATTYNGGEIVTDNGRTAVVVNQYTSGASYDADVTNGDLITIVDVSAFQDFNTAIAAASTKATFHNNDRFGIADSEASNALKAVTWTQVKANVKSYADTLYQPLSAVLTATTASFLVADETKLDGIEALADVTDAGNVGSSINGAAEQTVLEDTNRFAIVDDGVLKWSLWSTLKTAIQTFLADLLVKPGTICMSGGTTADSGYLACDGTSYLRATYPSLFARIGTTWGAVDGTHFNVPDLRDEFIRGASGTRAVGSSASDSIKSHTHSLTMDAIPPHTHTYGPKAGVYGANSDPYGSTDFRPSVGDSTGSTTTLTTSSNGGSTPTGTVGSTGSTETAPRHKVVLFQIKT